MRAWPWPVLAMAAFLLAVGCDELALSGAGSSDARGLSDPAGPGAGQRKVIKPLTRMALAGGDVVVSGPEGYCIDPKTRRGGAGRGFAALASCRILTAGQAGVPVEPVLMTVTVGPKGDAEDLPAPEVLATAQGAPLLSGETHDGLVLARLAEGGGQALDGGDARHWRGVFLQGGRVVGLALYAPEGSPMTGPPGAGLLRDLRGRIVAHSPPRTADTVSEPETTDPARRRGLLARILDP